MVDNKHRQISGYRDLSEAEITAINNIKAKAEEVGALFNELKTMPDVDQRAVSIAITDAQTAFMWAARAVARPTTF